MKQDLFVKNSVFAVLQKKCYNDFQAHRGAEAGAKHYRQHSNFKPDAVTACVSYAVSVIGKA